MRHDHALPRVTDIWVRVAVIVWTVSLLVVSVRALVQPRNRTLFPTYATAGLDWRVSADLYRHYQDQPEKHLDQFRYSPLVAALLVPWSFLPEGLGGALWRIGQAAVFLGGAWWWARTCLKDPYILGIHGSVSSRGFGRMGLLFVLLLPLALASLANGQVNLLVAGFLLAALAAVDEERWVIAAICIGLATALKLYPLAMGLLLLVCYPRRLALPLLSALVAMAAIPFLLQHPQYVWEQYASWLHNLSLNESRRDWVAPMAYRDLWLLCKLWQVPMKPLAYEIVQLALALACAGLCVAARLRGLPRRRILTMVLTLGTGWMMLVGPSIESSTFVLMAPALAWTLLDPETPRGVRWSAWGATACLTACLTASLFPGTTIVHGLGLHPLASLLFFGSALVRAARDVGARTESVAPQCVATVRAA